MAAGSTPAWLKQRGMETELGLWIQLHRVPTPALPLSLGKLLNFPELRSLHFYSRSNGASFKVGDNKIIHIKRKVYSLPYNQYLIIPITKCKF